MIVVAPSLGRAAVPTGQEGAFARKAQVAGRVEPDRLRQDDGAAALRIDAGGAQAMDHRAMRRAAIRGPLLAAALLGLAGSARAEDVPRLLRDPQVAGRVEPDRLRQDDGAAALRIDAGGAQAMDSSAWRPPTGPRRSPAPSGSPPR
jgi:hypothetical protein